MRSEEEYDDVDGWSSSTPSPISLENWDVFQSHPWVGAIMQRYRDRDQRVAKRACIRVLSDLRALNDKHAQEHRRAAFTSIDGRVKAEDSLCKKLYRKCLANAPSSGVTQATVNKMRSQIKDVCGVRISVPYIDEVGTAVNDLVRPELQLLGYAINLGSRYQDKDYLDAGDEFGYRSYHFFVKVPARIDIYDRTEMVLCEVQARSELQHVWADKSHNLLYKQGNGWDYSDQHVLEDMRQLSNHLRAADQFLVSIRDRIGKQATS